MVLKHTFEQNASVHGHNNNNHATNKIQKNNSNNNHKIHYHNYSQHENSSPPFRVIGIALVVDQVGKGPQMILRYPTSTSSSSVVGIDGTGSLTTTGEDSYNNSIDNNNNPTTGGTTSIGGGISSTTSSSVPMVGGDGGGGGSSGKKGTTTTTSTSRTSTTRSKSRMGKTADNDTDNLFFRLPPRQIAKLFRPKPALCHLLKLTILPSTGNANKNAQLQKMVNVDTE